ncbi:hypothetical protein AB3X94_06455 [Paraburkholderia sp. BR10923]|uniref:hypothetical protein n=1 Tax=Paraburkholderia sp. BR10923 TaxID=3236992 RepID=UPI0034CD75D7
MMKTTKAGTAREAKERGESRFVWSCKQHGETEHYASNLRCRECQKETANSRWDHIRKDPEAKAQHNARQRASMAKLREEPKQRAKTINNRARQRLRQYGRPLPTPEILEECLGFVVAMPEGCEVDHAVPLKGAHPITKEWVVSGLHVPYNLEAMEKRSNRIKAHWFDPEALLEFQKPYNSYPGGQFHGEIGEVEFQRYCEPVTLELMTKVEFWQAVVEGANEDMRRFLEAA